MGCTAVSAESGSGDHRIALSCTGSERSGPAHSPASVRDWSALYEIDLAQRQYCADDCQQWNPIAEVTDRLFVLHRTVDGGIFIDRASGDYTMSLNFGDLHAERDAKCRQVAPRSDVAPPR
ncbi:hypothetical protein [Aurantiacibacter luteus]|uniref:hypothetical protein n=1 Tax=Aurantiacibacter luteus TaxID=1581420 RepID=UPI0012E0270D|nr:hypothetical protein [Aurantiacibacter luteus]